MSGCAVYSRQRAGAGAEGGRWGGDRASTHPADLPSLFAGNGHFELLEAGELPVKFQAASAWPKACMQEWGTKRSPSTPLPLWELLPTNQDREQAVAESGLGGW